MASDIGSVDEAQDTDRAELGSRYKRSRRLSFSLVACTVITALWLVFNGDATPQDVEILNIVSNLAMAVTISWMAAAHGREAYTKGKKG